MHVTSRACRDRVYHGLSRKRCADLRLDTRDPGPRAAGRRSTRHVASTADRATKALLWVHVLSLPHDVEIICTSKEREVKLNFSIKFI